MKGVRQKLNGRKCRANDGSGSGPSSTDSYKIEGEVLLLRVRLNDGAVGA